LLKNIMFIYATVKH